jgi:hypothetical protein
MPAQPGVFILVATAISRREFCFVFWCSSILLVVSVNLGIKAEMFKTEVLRLQYSVPYF